MTKRSHSLPEFYTERIEVQLARLGFSLRDPRRLAQAVLRLSGHYTQNPLASTPWSEPWAQAASLAYYFPLNYARNSAVAKEAQRLGFFSGLERLFDFGVGTASGILSFSEQWPASHRTGFDADATALRLATALASGGTHTIDFELSQTGHAQMPRGFRSPEKTLVLASYSLTELREAPPWWLEAEAVAIIEPSTRDDGRSLMLLRNSLLERGYRIWAPCTHQGQCPMLVHSERDWCHDRVHWLAPAWFIELEKYLPMKNRTLTFSYLLARKTMMPPSALGELARLTGDMLVEKGKTRQSICRGEAREFLAWFPQRMARGEVLELERGALAKLKADLQIKASEVRVNSPDDIEIMTSDRKV